MNEKTKGWRLTLSTCCLAYFLQAAVVNVISVLFIPLKEQFCLTYSQLGILVLANFVAQFFCDVLLGSMIDRHGFRPFALLSPLAAIGGFLLFSLAPVLMPAAPFFLFLCGTVLFAGAGGLMELLLSPVVNSLPFAMEKRASLLSFVHSAYNWGHLLVVLFTTLMIHLWGVTAWQMVLLSWCILSALVFFLFLKIPLPEPGGKEMRERKKGELLNPTFFLCVVVILAGAASELVIAQWASPFIEKGLSVSKTAGDILGVCTFAVAMGTGRVLYGLFGRGTDMRKNLTLSFGLALVCYLVVGLAPGETLPLIAIFISGFGVALLWPGTLTMASERFPAGGALMFGILAAAGDIGGALGPWLTGKLTDVFSASSTGGELALKMGLSFEQFGLRAGMLAGVVFPLLGLLTLLFLGKKKI